MPEQRELQAALNLLAGTSGLDAQAAANSALTSVARFGAGAGQMSSTKSGIYNFIGPNQSTSSNLVNQRLRLWPVAFAKACTLSRIGAEITGAGESGSVLRLGIYSDTGDFYPGALLLDAGTIDGTSATVQEITISQSINPGIYWFGGAVQLAPTTQPTVRIPSTTIMPIPAGANTAVNNTTACLVQSSIGNAGLPTTFSTTVTVDTVPPPRVFWKIL